MFLEHWNRQKNISNIRQRFSCLLDCKNMQKKNFIMAFLKIHFICFEMDMDRPDKYENTFGIQYILTFLSISPFMRHPWFPTRKASKLTFYLLWAPIMEHNAGANCLFQCSRNIGWEVNDCVFFKFNWLSSVFLSKIEVQREQNYGWNSLRQLASAVLT